MPQIGGPTVLKLLSTVPNTSTGILYCILVDLSTVGGGRCCGKKLVCRGTRTVVGSKATGGLVCRLLGPIKGMDVTGGSAAAATTQKTWARGGGEVSPETNLKGTVSRDFRPLCSCLKGQCHEISDLQFFSSFKPDWAMDQRNKIFTILVKISPSYSNKDDTMSLAFI